MEFGFIKLRVKAGGFIKLFILSKSAVKFTRFVSFYFRIAVPGLAIKKLLMEVYRHLKRQIFS